MLNSNSNISAKDLLAISSKRGPKKPADLGYKVNNDSYKKDAVKPTTYTSNAAIKSLNESTDVYKQLRRETGEE